MHRVNVEGYWTTAQIADELGVRPDTWSSYVSRGHAPKPDMRVGATPLWRIDTIRQWQANRPGPGARTDLEGP